MFFETRFMSQQLKVHNYKKKHVLNGPPSNAMFCEPHAFNCERVNFIIIIISNVLLKYFLPKLII